MKTKNIVKLLLIVFPFLLFSCDLNKSPLGEYSELTRSGEDEGGERIKYKDRAEMYTQYQLIYQRMRDNQEHWYLDYMLLAEAHADNAYGGTTGAEVIPFETNGVDASNSVLLRDWDRYLTDIAQANTIICNIDQVPDASFDKAEREQWKAEAKIYRAMILFDMVRIWGNFPLITYEAGDITAENIEEVYPQYFPEQSTPEEVYAQILQDLTEALPYAPAANQSNKTLLTKSVARTLLAKIHAEKVLQDYDKVIQYCDEVINDGFRLVSNYSDLFAMNADNTDTKNRNTSESILEMQYFPGAGNWVSWMFGRNTANWDESFTWAKWVTPSRDLIKEFQDEKDEIRFKESVVYYTCTWSNYYPSDNYPFAYKCRSGYSNIIKLRLADVMLLKAEALAQKNNLGDAAVIVNTIRARVNLPALGSAATSSKENMLNAILHERRLELAFEGHRWFDLIRFGKLQEVMNSINSKDSGRLPQRRLFTQDSELHPIPQSALDQNENLVQNPGN